MESIDFFVIALEHIAHVGTQARLVPRYPPLKERNRVNREDNQYSIASATSSISTATSFCSPSSTKCAVSPTRFLRPLVNRNPTQTACNYSAGYDAMSWSMEHINDQPQWPM